jgi:hypothetical protein
VIARGDVSVDISTIKNIETVILAGQMHERGALLAEAARLANEDTSTSVRNLDARH